MYKSKRILHRLGIISLALLGLVAGGMPISQVTGNAAHRVHTKRSVHHVRRTKRADHVKRSAVKTHAEHRVTKSVNAKEAKRGHSHKQMRRTFKKANRKTMKTASSRRGSTSIKPEHRGTDRDPIAIGPNDDK